MGIYSNISAYEAPDHNPAKGPISETHESVEDFQDLPCVIIEDSEFDNFLIDLRLIPKEVTHIHFWRG